MTYIMKSRKVLIDAIMMTTVEIPVRYPDLIDYGFNPCKYTDLYKQQLFGNYNDTLIGFSDFVYDIIYYNTYFTTCVDAEDGEFPSAYKQNCTNIVSQVGNMYGYMLRFILRYI